MIRYIKLLFCNFFYLIISIFIKKDNYSIVLGSWRGESFSDNTLYLAEYISKNFPEYKLYWVGKKEIREIVENSQLNLIFLEMGKFKTNLTIIKCKYCFVSQKYHVDISKYYLLHNMIICYLHHGTPVKKWGDDGLNKPVAKNFIGLIKDTVKSKRINYNYYSSSSKLNSIVLCSAMKSCSCSMDKIIPSGSPRNDMFLSCNEKLAQEYQKKYKKIIGFQGTPKTILYLPTYRRIENNVFSFSKISIEQQALITNILEKHNAVLIEKSHFASHDQIISNHPKGRLFFSDGKVNVQEML